MSTQHDTPAAFQPAFCHRRDCAAGPDTPFCSGCGADIAAYLEVTTAAHDAVRLDDAATQVTSVARQLNGARERPLWTNGTNGAVDTKPLVRLPAREPVPIEPPSEQVAAAGPASWHDRAVVASFAAATLAGALAAVAADLI